ncbi:hypothetical protein GCM10011507_14880 [Edaphobacter acidisoli]|uniref:Uncharacterized protein n=1 Tax=Edaphobacter acidisoli TaxID=2040573 RepID=A0A916RRG5_9BACT|nr:hypothetical protein [Edaphobacter acidisoli]GGA64316.1 hypothetical protein GCM10011507_14880 [Edaphobacter acidisoli]
MIWFRIKVAIINIGIAAALVYRYWTGTPLRTILIIGALAFVFANVLMVISQEQQAKARNAGRTPSNKS